MKLQRGASQLIDDDLFALAFDIRSSPSAPAATELRENVQIFNAVLFRGLRIQKTVCEMLPAVFLTRIVLVIFLFSFFEGGRFSAYLDDELPFQQSEG